MDNERLENKMLSEIEEIIQAIQNHKEPISKNITPEVLKQISDLEEAIGVLSELQRTAFEIAGIDQEKLKEEVLASTDINPKSKNLINRAESITREATTVKLALSKAIKKRKSSKKVLKSKEDDAATKQEVRERRKLFKSIGGDSSWIPL